MDRCRRRRPARGGFTLMEVLLVLVILVILGSMAGVFIRGAQRKARADAARSQIGIFENAVKMYELNAQSYPEYGRGTGRPANTADRCHRRDLGRSLPGPGSAAGPLGESVPVRIDRSRHLPHLVDGSRWNRWIGRRSSVVSIRTQACLPQFVSPGIDCHVVRAWGNLAERGREPSRMHAGWSMPPA